MHKLFHTHYGKIEMAKGILLIHSEIARKDLNGWFSNRSMISILETFLLLQNFLLLVQITFIACQVTAD